MQKNENQNDNNIKRNYCYLDINDKNNIKFNYSSDYLENILKVKVSFNKELEFTSPIKLDKFIDKVFSKKYNDYFNTSLALVKSYSKKKKLSNFEASKFLNDFYINLSNNLSKNKETVLCLKKDIIENLGGAILYAYKTISDYKIKDEQKLIEELNKNDTVKYDNFIKSYNKYIDSLSIKERKKTNFIIFLEIFKQRVTVPYIFIFLKQLLEQYKTIHFYFDDIVEDSECLYAIILNIKLIFSNDIKVSIYFRNYSLFKEISNAYQDVLVGKELKKGRFLKLSDFDNNYNTRKWNFDTKYIKSYPSEIVKVYSSNEIESFDLFDYEIVNLKSFDINTDDKNDYLVKTFSTLYEQIIYFFYIISTYRNIQSFQLIIPENYSIEIKHYFKSINIELSDYNILDFLLKNVFNLKELEIDFNCLDSKTFEKVILLIYQNTLLKDLKISLFSTNEIYYHSNLYKLIQQHQKFKNNLNFLNEEETDFDKIIIDKLLQFFQENLSIFFYIIQNKVSLVNLSIYCELPEILINNEKYKMIIIKLFINLLLYISNKDNIRYIKLLFPNITLDALKFPVISDILEEINFEKNALKLEELYIQFDFCNIYNLSNLITSRLTVLSICQLDSVSFNNIIEYISNPKFSFTCKISNLTIGLTEDVELSEGLKSSFKCISKAPFCYLEEFTFISDIIFNFDEYNFLMECFNKIYYNICFVCNKESNDEIKQFKKDFKSIFCYYIEPFDRKKAYSNVYVLKTLIKMNIKYKQNITLKNILKFLYPEVLQSFIFKN